MGSRAMFARSCPSAGIFVGFHSQASHYCKAGTDAGRVALGSLMVLGENSSQQGDCISEKGTQSGTSMCFQDHQGKD